MSTGLTQRGRRWLARADRQRLVPVSDGLYLFEGWSGSSGAGRALELLCARPALHLTCEIDEAAARVSRSLYAKVSDPPRHLAVPLLAMDHAGKLQEAARIGVDGDGDENALTQKEGPWGPG